MNLIKIFEGSFSGSVLYENPNYIAPLVHRQMIRQKASIKYQNRMTQKLDLENRRPTGDTYMVDETDEIFKIK
jgi:ribosome biogenesis protein BRX1